MVSRGTESETHVDTRSTRQPMIFMGRGQIPARRWRRLRRSWETRPLFTGSLRSSLLAMTICEASKSVTAVIQSYMDRVFGAWINVISHVGLDCVVFGLVQSFIPHVSMWLRVQNLVDAKRRQRSRWKFGCLD
ncbi:hypothetical protein Pdw03_2142 [Penicillium digitatum]|uniref:Uncharacterized protein n=1 Tax=Penicillium digitatum TaxID=36651 RepID=A0A7T6XU00_PENDI|nr:hypothetical protein Pdw03_2142 [Penicillium digitatum]